MTNTELKNIGAIPVDMYKNMQRSQFGTVANAMNSANGLEQTITTLTQTLAKTIDTVYYTVPGKLSDYVSIDVGTGAYALDFLQYATQIVGNEGKQGLIDPLSEGVNKDAHVSINVGSFSIKNNFWRADYTLTNEQVNIARRNTINFSLVEKKEQARKSVYDRMVQDAFFVGLGDGKSFGLLNQPEVTVETTILPTSLTAMTDTQFETFLGQIGNAYAENNNYTIRPNRLLMPSSDYYSLVQPFGTFGYTRLQVLENALKGIGGGDFRILHTQYNNNASADGQHGRYVFYNAAADNICAYMPVPYTPMPLFPQGSLDLISQAYGQFATPVATRPTALLYADVQA